MKNTQPTQPAAKNTTPKNTFNTSLIQIGENIRKRREALGMSQTDLANEVGTNRSAICKYETGIREMGIGKLAEIAEVLDCSPSECFGAKTQAEDKLGTIVQRLLSLDDTSRNQIVSAMEYMLVGAENCRHK